MTSINQNPFITTPVKATAFAQVKKIMCKSLHLVKRTIGISNNAAKPSRKINVKTDENGLDYEESTELNCEKNIFKINKKSEIIDTRAHHKEAVSIRSSLKNQSNKKNKSSCHTEKAAVTLTKHSLLNNTDDMDISRTAFINEVAKNVVKELQKTVMPNDKEKLIWQSQEFDTYIPVQINRAIDAAAVKLNEERTVFHDHQDIKKKLTLLGDKSSKNKIIQDTLADLGLTQAFAAVKCLADKAQPSIEHTTRIYMTKNKLANAELTVDISHHVYEIIFECKGQIALVKD